MIEAHCAEAHGAAPALGGGGSLGQRFCREHFAGGVATLVGCSVDIFESATRLAEMGGSVGTYLHRCLSRLEAVVHFVRVLFLKLRFGSLLVW